MAGVGFDHFLIKLPSECTEWTIVYPHNHFFSIIFNICNYFDLGCFETDDLFFTVDCQCLTNKHVAKNSRYFICPNS